MAISAKDVAALRKQTGAGMMDCKKALTEAGGDSDAAVDILRKKGQKVAAKRSDRDATEGGIFAQASTDNKTAVILELNSETDFVARNDDFQNLGNSILEVAISEQPADLEALKAAKMEGRSIEDHLTDAMGRIGEKIDLRRYDSVSGEGVTTYIHPGARVGVVVAFNGVDGVDLDSVGKDVAMQIAALRPISVDESDVPEEVKQKELEIGREQALAEGKPEAIVDKIAQGKLNRFYKDSTLIAQPFVKDSSKSVGQYLKEVSPKLKVKAFLRFELGGI